MKPDRAIEILDEYDVNFADISAEEIADAMQMAIEALEKQIPKPVQYETDYTWGIGNKQPICPECESDVSKIVFFPVDEVEAKSCSYCEFCGQAIDWGDKDESRTSNRND